MRTTIRPIRWLLTALASLVALGAIGCGDGDGLAQYVPSKLGATIQSTELSELVPTVAHVTWSVHGAEGEVTSWIEFGRDDSYGFEAAGRRSGYGNYEAWLMGVGPQTDLHFRAGVADDDQQAYTDDHTLTTGSAHPDLPPIEVLGTADQLPDGGLIATTLVQNPPAAVILDAQGEYVWWSIREGSENAGVSASELSHDGESVLFIDFDTPAGDDDEVKDCRFVRAALDGSDQVTFPVEEGHHDFTELADGTLAFLLFDVRTSQESDLPITGDLILETSADGTTTREVWSTWDTLPVVIDDESVTPWDWTHANSIVHDEGTDSYYVGLRTLGSIVSVDRGSGEQLEVIGGDESDFSTIDGQTGFFRHQHRYNLLDDGIVVFDNREDEPEGSRAVELSLVRTSGLAEEVWSHRPDPPLHSHSLGDVWRLPSGSTLITWSTEGEIHAVNDDGERVWGLAVDEPASFGYTRWYPDEGR